MVASVSVWVCVAAVGSALLGFSDCSAGCECHDPPSCREQMGADPPPACDHGLECLYYLPGETEGCLRPCETNEDCPQGYYCRQDAASSCAGCIDRIDVCAHKQWCVR
jgi:hypothetical protein